MQARRNLKRTYGKRYKKNPYRKSKINFLRPYIPKGFYWTTYKFRTVSIAQCDANGDSNFYYGAQAIFGNVGLANLQPFFESFKVVYVTFDININQQMSTALGAYPVVAAITHLPSASIPAGQISSRVFSTNNYKSLSATTGTESSMKLRWVCDPHDPTENDFYPLTSAAIALPTTGGLIISFNGPAAMANQNPFTVVSTFYCILRGQGCAFLG